jgi:hypothetical protein
MPPRHVLWIIFACLVIAQTAVADSVTCRMGTGCLNAPDHFDWTANFGPPFTDVLDNSVATTAGGHQALLTFATGGEGQRRDQGVGWYGNFSPGDELLWTGSTDGPMTFTFLNGFTVSGIGTQIEADSPGDFTAFIQAYDAQDQLLASFSENGNSNYNNDGSAIFIGLANVPGITKAVFGVTSCSADCGDFAINQLDIVPTEVPEAPSILLLGSGLALILGMLRIRARL